MFRRIAGQASSAGAGRFAGRERGQREGMNAAGHPLGDGIIHKAMSRRPGEVFEARTHEMDAEMAAFASAGVAGVQVAVVVHFEG